MTKIFKIPFATQGDRASIPVETQADGAVSYTQGYGYDYERDQATDPAAKDIEREKMNSLFHDVTEAVGEVQLLGAAKWNAAGKPYPIRCVVYHKDKVWQSKVGNNNIEPIAGAAWAELKADATASDVGAYSKTEADTKYQPKGNYQAAGDFATKAEVKTGLDGKLNTSIIKQTPGTSTTDIMSQKAVTDAISDSQVNVPAATSEVSGKVKISSDIAIKDASVAASTEITSEINESAKRKFVTDVIPASLPPLNLSCIKLWLKNPLNSDYFVVTQKNQGARGYVAVSVTDDVVSADKDNEGGRSNIRPSDVIDLKEVFVGRFKPYEIGENVKVHSLTADSARKMYGIMNIGYDDNRAIQQSEVISDVNFNLFNCYLLPNLSGITYAVQNSNTVIQLGTSYNSSDNVEIHISADNVTYKLLKTVSLKTAFQSVVGHVKVKVDIDISPYGYVKIINKSKNNNDAYVIGVDILALDKCNVDTKFDHAFISSDKSISSIENKYQNTKGATEFAAREKNGRWFGTFHGGHIKFHQRINLYENRYNVDDGLSAVNTLPWAALTTDVRLLSISQLSINSTIYDYSVTTMFGDGAHVSDTTIKHRSGKLINCSDVYINMCTTAPDFNWIHHPEVIKDANWNSVDFKIGQTGFVEQYQPATNKTLRNYFSQVSMYKNGQNGCYIKFSPIYNKIYYALIINNNDTLKDINFTTCKAYS